MRVLVLGASGQLGQAMVGRLSGDHEVIATTRRELDVTDGAVVGARIAAIRPEAIINCSAYTDVDRAEDEPVQAFTVNAMAVRWIARAAGAVGAVLVHYSTDFVFDGRTDRPYVESDPPNPRGTYAMSKLLGEWFAAETPRHYVLRVESLFGGPKARSSIDRIRDAILAGTPVRAFGDRAVSPSFVDDVVTATVTLLEGGAPSGLYHCVNSGWTTWVGLAEELARLLGRPDAPIEAVRMADLNMRVSRPLFAALSNAKLASAGAVMPTWQQALYRYID